MADVYLVPQVESARRFGVDMARWPLISAIDAACMLPAFARRRRCGNRMRRKKDAPAPRIAGAGAMKSGCRVGGVDPSAGEEALRDAR